MQITALNIYPIKGCRGIPLREVAVDRIGLVGDRRLMLVSHDNRFLSQREAPALATLEPALDAERIRVRAPDRELLDLTIDPAGAPREVWVWWDHGIMATDQGDRAAQWFSDALGINCRLVHFGAAARNRVDPAYSIRTAADTAFTDGYPIMAVLQESLDDLNTRLKEPVPMARFRPSVVVAGDAAWTEDEWRGLQLGDLACDAVKPCGRCVVTTTDQLTGARNAAQEPLRTLATFRTIPRLGAIFGQNIVPREIGRLQVGDAVRRT